MSRRAARRIAVFIAAFVVPVLATVAVHVHQPPDLHVSPIVTTVAVDPPATITLPLPSIAAAAAEVEAEVAYAQAQADDAERTRLFLEAEARKKATPPPAPRSYVAPAAETRGHNWDAVAACESGGNWADNTGNGYYGGLQFSLGTWRGVGGTGMPNDASRDTQIEMAERALAGSSWQQQWPVCGKYL